MRSLLSICDIKDEIPEILELATKFKEGKINEKPLEDKTLAMIFQKSSTRTRVSFEVGMNELGGNAIFLSNNDIQMGRGEPIADTAKVLSRYVHGIMIRALEHEDVVEFSKESDVPIISGLTNLEHPCQALADILTVKEYFKDFNGKFTYVGDGNNVCNSLLLICACIGMNIAVACPEGYEPNEDIIKKANKIAKENNSYVVITNDVEVAVKNATVVYTDVWVSMGDEKEQGKRKKALKKYQVNQKLMELANQDAIFMHCLPAIRGEEVSGEVIDGPQSAVIDQAENRLHAQKAVLYYFLK
ncbi:MAG: ornithine carbamoyltransferase [Methanobrevibacter arboriphilus]|jgi:ornithine carbamoyltransferase|uniref:Ornithine carbamoyltransferase n=2 Tax=Methanobrevibacter arboriphilus TaxID=39441 RepID=A0ACA8R3S0_METAZ|nr:ornithine carbamoyltransferase [Methanobrevibacter arboriphilus]MBF4468706.1 ornithine carbamoyltransferase [Methanobrevibacter arboriphilus]MCC7562478.1 ornithine carbamoyltransferase [Methanobrevibacter arboriphilus]BBL62140.1 ornithine carbamoyltransferase [Methanobrevibacter arboriphilus]GLI11828.1 ornithine carbamoyltransferase [Methanobrevibacter arboriphilus]